MNAPIRTGPVIRPVPVTSAERFFVGTRIMTAEESVRSLGLTHALMADTIDVPCPTHDAERGCPCWGSNLSGVAAYCQSRVARGKRDANRKTHFVPQPSIHALTITELPVPPRRSR
jgi:hypothetical protein